MKVRCSFLGMNPYIDLCIYVYTSMLILLIPLCIKEKLNVKANIPYLEDGICEQTG